MPELRLEIDLGAAVGATMTKNRCVGPKKHRWQGRGPNRKCIKCGYHPPHISESFPQVKA